MPIVVTLLIGVLLGVGLVVATVVDKQREPVPDTFRVLLGLATAIGMLGALSVQVTA